MSTYRSYRFDQPEVAAALRKVLQTPVGRRMVLRLGGATVLGTLLSRFGVGTAEGAGSGLHAPEQGARPRESRDLYFVLGEAATAGRQLRLQVGSKEYPLQVMTKQARQKLAAQGGLYAKM